MVSITYDEQKHVYVDDTDEKKPSTECVCPVCGNTDQDGLEACADCYNAMVSEVAEMQQQRDRALAMVCELEGGLDNFKKEIIRLRDELAQINSYLNY